ncbi:MAG TPA: dienelactone hydrolase family protein, partial [Verrucomicrobiae bacterium]|nr:dienelactone hydrolase family protein [Verrucomicrobiae bacterium]
NTSAQEWAKARLEKSPRHIEWVNVKQGERTIKSSIAFPEVKDKATSVVVIHEIFGLTDWVRGVTDQLAEAGYIAIAPDLLSGTAPGGGGSAELGGPDGARAVIGKLPPDQITKDLNAVVDYVSKLPSCNGKVAVMGFCWGGGQSFRFATNNKDIKAAMAFYGTGPETDADIKRIHAPVYGFYGGNDNRVNATIPTSEKLMKDAGKKYEPVVYEGAGHGFMRAGEDTAGNEPNKKARDQAWQRVKDILKKI